MGKRLFYIWLILSSLILSNISIAAEPEPAVTPMTAEMAVNRAQQQTGNPLPLNTDTGRALLEQINIAQYRLSQKISQIEGKEVRLPVIPGNIRESDNVLRMLDAGLATLYQLDPPAIKNVIPAGREAVSQQQQVAADTQRIYWNAIGAQQNERKLMQLISKTSKILTASVEKPRKNSKINDNTIQIHPEARSDLLKILSELKQMLAENQRHLKTLKKQTGIKSDEFLPLPMGVEPLSVPRLNVPPSQLDSRTLLTFNLAAKDILAQSKTRIDLLTPGISHNWSVNNSFNTNNWLSTGKYMAFDVYNQIDKLQRKQTLKEKVEDKNDKPMLAAALLSRAHISYNLYLSELEKFQLAGCLKQLNDQLITLQLENNEETAENVVENLRAEISNLRLISQQYQHYAQLRGAFETLLVSYLVQPGSQKVLIRNQRFDSKQCYQPMAMNQPKPIVKVEPEKPIKPVQTKPAQPIPQPKPVAKPAPRKNDDWAMQQNPKMFTLQILASDDKARLNRYIRKHKLGNKAHVTRISKSGKTRYAIHYGLYRDKEMAFIAQFKLPLTVQDENQIWIRRISDIQKKK